MFLEKNEDEQFWDFKLLFLQHGDMKMHVPRIIKTIALVFSLFYVLNAFTMYLSSAITVNQQQAPFNSINPASCNNSYCDADWRRAWNGNGDTFAVDAILDNANCIVMAGSMASSYNGQ